ncbi:MAG: HAD family hydrolase, partial [Bacteroidota bacterium]
MSHFAKNLRFLRQQQDVPLSELALQLNLWENTLTNLERGREEPGIETLLKLSDRFGLPVDHLLRRDLDLDQQRARKRKIKLILLDVDGTLTDGGMYYNERGEQSKRFNVKDGLIIHRLITRQNLRFGLISGGSTEPILRARADALGIDRVYTGRRPKVAVIQEWLAELNLKWEQIAYVGDDLNDLPPLRKAGLSACPADAADAV